MSDTITLPGRPEVEREEKTKRQPPYNVILHDDDDHAIQNGIVLLIQLFG
jgi:ATP-dependent Clp protease adaptor protein ClpS